MPNPNKGAPDARQHNPSPEYLRGLIAAAGISQREAARRVGVNDREMRHWLTGRVTCPYSVQYCLEVISSGSASGDLRDDNLG